MQLSPHAFHILLALSDRDRHGNGIVRRVLSLTDGELHLWPVTLYRTLDRLLGDGLIVELSDPEEHPAGESRRRRYYRLTDAGAEALDVEARHLDELARTARRNLAGRESRT